MTTLNMKAVAPYLVGVAAAAGALYWLIKVQKGGKDDPYKWATLTGSPWLWDREDVTAPKGDTYKTTTWDMGSIAGKL